MNPSLTLYDLCAASRDVTFSPYCWRVKMALKHKQLPFTTVPVHFTEIPGIVEGGEKAVPVLVEVDGTIVRDSLAIAYHLDDRYPDTPPLFCGENTRALSQFVTTFSLTHLHVHILKAIVFDIFTALADEDKDYFRKSREQRFFCGMPLEAVQENGRKTARADFMAATKPLEMALSRTHWLGGKSPCYADYIFFGSLQWHRILSNFPLYEPESALGQWFERGLDLFEGYGRAAPCAI